MGERFRLIYLKSADLEKSKTNEPISSHTSEDIARDDSYRFKIPESLSAQAVLEKASADLKAPDSKARILAIRYLETADPSVAFPLVEEVLCDEEPEVRLQALSSLIKLKHPNLILVLKKFLKDKDPRVRLLALRGIFRIGEKIDLNLLLQFLSDESPWVRRKLATLIGWGQAQGAFPILMELCKDGNAEVRKAALFSLVTLYPEESENRLIEAMTDPDANIRKWARETVETIAARPRKGETERASPIERKR